MARGFGIGIGWLLLAYLLVVTLAAGLFVLDRRFGAAGVLDSADRLASVAAGLITLFGFVLVYRQLRLQADGSDIAAILAISAQINAAIGELNFNCKDQAGGIDREKWATVFRTLVTVYETACFTHNENMLQEKARYLLGGYLGGGLDDLYADPALRQWLDSIRAETPGALTEIERFRARR